MAEPVTLTARAVSLTLAHFYNCRPCRDPLLRVRSGILIAQGFPEADLEDRLPL